MPTASLKKTYSAKPGEVTQKWWVIDAQDKVLGRLASRLALVLQGKNKPEYTPHVDTGDFVVVINCEKVALTRDKAGKKVYRRHTGWIGGLKEVSFTEMIEKHPERVIQLAVRRMLPKTRLGRKMFSKLKVYAGTEHPHAAQQPQTLEL